MACMKVTTINLLSDRLPTEIKNLLELDPGGLFKLQKYSTDSWCDKIKAIRAYPESNHESVVLENHYWTMLLGTHNWIKIIKSVDENYHITSSDAGIVFTLKALFPHDSLLPCAD